MSEGERPVIGQLIPWKELEAGLSMLHVLHLPHALTRRYPGGCGCRGRQTQEGGWGTTAIVPGFQEYS